MSTNIYTACTRGQGVDVFMKGVFARTARDYLTPVVDKKERETLRAAEDAISRQTATLIMNCIAWLQERPFWTGRVSLQMAGGLIGSSYGITFRDKRAPDPKVEIRELMTRDGGMYRTEVILTGLLKYIEKDYSPPSDIEINGRKVILRDMGRDAGGQRISVTVDLARERAKGLTKLMRLLINECVDREYITIPEPKMPKKNIARKRERAVAAES